MAWTEQCKIAFKMNAEHQVFTQKGRKNITRVLKKLSKESGIPYETLKRWYYEKEEDKKTRLNSVKNDTVSEPAENSEKNENPTDITDLICIMCKKNQVEILTSTGKPVGRNSKYFGLCSECRKKVKIKADAIALANEENERSAEDLQKEKDFWKVFPEQIEAIVDEFREKVFSPPSKGISIDSINSAKNSVKDLMLYLDILNDE